MLSIRFLKSLERSAQFSECDTVQPDETGQRLICKESPKLAWQVHTHSDLLAPRLLDHFSDVPVVREV
jgi:hypothetical protein